MKKFPSIKTAPNFEVNVIGYDKLDGSNIRAFWKASEQRFTEFGTRTLKLHPSHQYLGGAIDLIRAGYETALNAIFLEKGYKEVTAFFEYYGEHSFAGRHDLSDQMEVKLIDLMIYKKGLVNPFEFATDYGGTGIPDVLFQGLLTPTLLRQIKDGELPGMTFEGVVFKGLGGKKGNYPITFKVKNTAWIERLKDLCGDDETLFRQLL